MFIVLTADDAVQTYTTAAIDSLVKRRSNPNGCDIKVREKKRGRLRGRVGRVHVEVEAW